MTILLIFGLFLSYIVLKSNFKSVDNKYLLYIIDKENYIFKNHLDINLYMSNMYENKTIKNQYYFEFLEKDFNKETIEKEIENGQIDGYVEVKSPKELQIVVSKDLLELNFILDKFINSKYNKESIKYNTNSLDLNKNKIKSLIKTYTIPIMFMLLSYVLFLMYGQFVSISTNLEKNSKIFEILLTKVKLSNIILGKIFGIMLVGLIQIIYFILLLFIVKGVCFIIKSPLFDLFYILNIRFVLKYIVYYILGFLTYGFMFFWIGNKVSQAEDLPINLAPIMFLISTSYFIGVLFFYFSQIPFIKVLMYVPLFSPFIVPFGNISFANQVIILVFTLSFMIVTFLFTVDTINKNFVKNKK